MWGGLYFFWKQQRKYHQTEYKIYKDGELTQYNKDAGEERQRQDIVARSTFFMIELYIGQQYKYHETYIENKCDLGK